MVIVAASGKIAGVRNMNRSADNKAARFSKANASSVFVLGIDPGATSGWVVYDATKRTAIASGQFEEHHTDFTAYTGSIDHVVIERPKGQGPTRPQVVECGIIFGRLIQWASLKWPAERVHEMLRYQVKSVLSKATHGEVHVRNDATAWAALVLLHGIGSGLKPKTRQGKVTDKGGCIGIVRSHERAALAAAVAWSLENLQPTTTKENEHAKESEQRR